MLSLYGAQTIQHALTMPLDPQLHHLLRRRVEALVTPDGYDLSELTHFLVVEPGDDEAAIVEEVGFSPLVNPIDGIRYGSPGFEPHWAYLIRHADIFEMIVTVGNNFAFILLIRDMDGVDPQLLELCRANAERGTT